MPNNILLLPNDKSPLVNQWQQFLKGQGLLNKEPNGVFDNDTFEATKAFQTKVGCKKIDGKAGDETLGKAAKLGFKPKLAQTLIKTRKDQLKYIKANLSDTTKQAIAGSIYTEDWLAAICARETGSLIAKKVNQGLSFEEVCKVMKGDFTQRPGETDKQFHGFGFWQIDIGSFPAFVASGKWQDPLATARFAVAVLNDKRKFLVKRKWDTKLNADQFERAVTAAYNCGEGNVDKALSNEEDVDARTADKNYSKDVFQFRAEYLAL